MIFAITRRERHVLLFISAAAYAAWIAGAGDRLDAQSVVPAIPSPEATLRVPPAIAAMIRRDPFAGAPQTTNDGIAPQIPTANPLEAAAHEGHFEGRDGEPIVPNLADPREMVSSVDASAEGSRDDALDAAPADPYSGIIVRAVAVGKPSLAYVQTPDGFVIVRRGDRLAGSRVASVELRGITLEDGTQLTLSQAHRAVSPSTRRAGLEAKIDALRALVGRLVGAAPANGASVASSPSPAATASVETIVTPGPLPTVVPYARPIGVNPTTNPYGATPYPVPDVQPIHTRGQS